MGPPTSESQTAPLAQSVRYLKGIGPRRAELLARIGVATVLDLLHLYPRRYEDRASLTPIARLKVGETATIRGRVAWVRLRPTRRILLLEAGIEDGTGEIVATWFNQPYLEAHLPRGRELILSGPVRIHKTLRMNAPEYEVLEPGEEGVHVGRIVPVYSITEGLTERWLRGVLKEVADRFAAGLADPLPAQIQAHEKLMALPEAIAQIHFPSDWASQKRARERVVFDEFFFFVLSLLAQRRIAVAEQQAPAFADDRSAREAFERALPFRLTASQGRVLEELARDLAKPYPMLRLLQGDVGSGKTVAAAFGMVLAKRAGWQSAMLCPTEVLAHQHARSLDRLLAPLGLRVALLVGGLTDSVAAPLLDALGRGAIDVVVGTHALLEERVAFARLGFLVVDEQHKFGVRQRARLVDRSPRPHVLLMSATPIPRTLGQTLYADLEISTLTELPAGRLPVKTYWITEKKEAEVFEFIRQRAKSGEQAYLIYPLIEEGKGALRAATREYERFRSSDFRDLQVGLIHGRMDRLEKDAVMDRFRAQDLHVLFSTSVVEVGLDNPHASIIVIEHADRFGLAQLHQMRGRVGRGSRQAYCFLFGSPETEEGKRRLRLLTKTQDGFQIAEEDLRMRGPGDLLGIRQSGIPAFALADLSKDQELLARALAWARRIAGEDPHLASPAHQPLGEAIARLEARLGGV